MGLETITSGSNSTIADLESTWPADGDNVNQGDDHIRNIKRALELTFPNIDATVSASATELNLAHSGGTVSGNLAVLGTLTAVGAVTLNLTLTVSSSAVVKGDLSVGGNFALAGTLTVDGAAGVSSIAVSATSNLNGTVSISGAATLLDTLTVSGALHAKTTLSAGGAVTLASTLTVGGATVLSDTLSVVGAVTLKSTLTAEGNTVLLGTLHVDGNVTASADLHVKGDLSVSGSAVIGGSLTVGADLHVKGDLSVSGTAVVGALKVGSGATVTLLGPNFVGTMTASAGATTIEVIGVAATARRLTLLFDDVKMNDGSSQLALAVSDDAAYPAAGRNGTCITQYGSDGFTDDWSADAAYVTHEMQNFTAGAVFGVLHLIKKSSTSDVWVLGGTLSHESAERIYGPAGTLDPGGTLDRIQLSVLGAGAFNGGEITVWEE